MGGLALRRLSIMNKACILKLGWKMQTGDQDFWCKVLRGKYQRSEDVTCGFSGGGQDSQLWRIRHSRWKVFSDEDSKDVGYGLRSGC